MLYLILNTATFAFTIFINYFASTGKLTGVSMEVLSDKYNTLFTPAGYAFSIWGLIYLLLTISLINQWRAHFQKDDKNDFTRLNPYFLLSNIFNSLWILSWTNEYLGFSVLIMLALLWSLLMLIIKTNSARHNAPIATIVGIWWAFGIYLGWIVLASVANISAFLVSINWDGFGLSESSWTIIMMAIATSIYLFILRTRNLRESVAVGVWGLIAIAYEQMDTSNNISNMAIILAVFLAIVICGHAWINRHALPFFGKNRI